MSRVPLLEAEGLVRRRGARTVLDGIGLSLADGETLGIIGGSGSGKSTLARILMGLEPPEAGSVRFRGTPLFGPLRSAAGQAVAPAARRGARLQIQAVFQDPYGSLDPRHRIGRILAEPLLVHGVDRSGRAGRVAEALAEVGLPPDAAARFPHEFSGGQRQRIAIARALIGHPALVVADEPVSALDVSVQAQVLNLLMELRARRGIAFLFITHDLGVIRHLAHRVAVLADGRIVEQGETAALLAAPRHPVTRGLLSAVPHGPRLIPAADPV